ncbi:hypothetical protein HPP92_012443 [Vanilla planifolia]|uniref:C2 domain-containing protein n=1 Tax=Vanilla planifolia TaxID=51239 RepID=A0A835QS50_VANPL|nr:hypothetical protein HPP92_012443 [Vanilla planifolia]
MTEKLVVEVVAAHNLMPKDGQGSSSPFVEVEFGHQKRRTRPKSKDLNPVWNERLVFSVSDADDLPYRSIDVAVYNERISAASGRNFLGKVRIPVASVPGPGEEGIPQLFPLEKRSIFSHIRGEISLKLYRIAASGDLQVAKAKNQQSREKPQMKQQKPNAAIAIPPSVLTQKPPELAPRPRRRC